jgi:aminopeptidase N
LEFYERFFKHPYPFRKLDSIFCPEFAWGAMEYPGAVTYNESLLPLRTNNTIDICRRGSVFLHEISHMWFGNLVTMQWWNGLWLNESFAEFISYKAFDSIYKELPFETSVPWVSFLCSKWRGYKEDQLPSTHPIAGEVEDTQVACSIFDGITYNKGSAVLKQLLALIGDETFSAALENYFNKYAYKNTTLEDLLTEFDQELKKKQGNAIDIFEWKEDWINKAGVNRITFARDAQTGRATIEQSACTPGHPTLRHHFVKIGFYDAEGNLIQAKDLTTSKTGSDEISLEGVEQYHAVLPNYDVRSSYSGFRIREGHP